MIYITIFSIYDLIVILFTYTLALNPIAPLLIYQLNKTFFDNLIQNIYFVDDLINIVSNNLQDPRISNILFVNFIMLGWILILVSPFRLENQLDFNNSKKTNFLTNFLDKLLNFVLRIRLDVDLKKYQIGTNITLKNHLRLDSEFEERLKKYEKWRYKEYVYKIRNPLRRRLLFEILIGLCLVISGILGYLVYTPEMNKLDDFLYSLYFFGAVALIASYYMKRHNFNTSIESNFPKENLTKSFLPKVQKSYKTNILNYIFNQSSQLAISNDSKIISATNELVGDNFLNSSQMKFTVNDFLEIPYAGLNINLFELRVSLSPNQVQSSGIYIKTSFREKFDGSIFVTTRNKSFFARQYINYPNLSQGLEFESESIDFNKQFFVHTTNQLEARLALKTNIMYALLQLANLNKNIYLKLEKNFLSLFIETSRDFFEYDYFAKKHLDINSISDQLKSEIYNQYELPIIVSLLLNPRSKNSL